MPIETVLVILCRAYLFRRASRERRKMPMRNVLESNREKKKRWRSIILVWVKWNVTQFIFFCERDFFFWSSLKNWIGFLRPLEYFIFFIHTCVSFLNIYLWGILLVGKLISKCWEIFWGLKLWFLLHSKKIPKNSSLTHKFYFHHITKYFLFNYANNLLSKKCFSFTRKKYSQLTSLDFPPKISSI